jgi:uncharacterized protein YyaL (SSP411 family)
MSRTNALKTASSPYLRQHQDNPVWWQEWSPETLRAALEEDMPIFVSVGYATCHWCHVMAAEAFSDAEVADAINRNFIAIKVDREERPDIDHFLMQFLLATRGQGGWPLNAFLTPNLRPMLALTYIPVTPRSGMPGLTDILDRVLEFYRDNKDTLPPFCLRKRRGEAPQDARTGGSGEDRPDNPAAATPEDFEHRLTNLVRRADHQAGGFGPGPKFPPHSTLLYLIFGVDRYRNEGASRVLRFTLDMMARRGLHDHLQGGFFRYCVDREWAIPHFEKMLYDQAMLLWVYARAARLYDDSHYRWVAERTITALEATFRLPGGAYAAAHDADTDHVEGATYVWSEEELRSAGSSKVDAIFEIRPGGNFEKGLHHLIRRDEDLRGGGGRRGVGDDAEINEIISRLLAVRNERPQPFRDDKIVTSWNALAGVALLEASLALNTPEAADRARELYAALARANRSTDGRWFRSSLDGTVNETEFLEDYAAILLFETYLLEHTASPDARDELRGAMAENEERISAFRLEGDWISSLASDIDPVPADDFDSPTPSPVTLTEMAFQRSAILTGRVAPEPPLRPEMTGDFGNLAAALAAGEWYFIEDPDPSGSRVRQSAPLHSLIVEAPVTAWCFRKVCTPGRPDSAQLL